MHEKRANNNVCNYMVRRKRFFFHLNRLKIEKITHSLFNDEIAYDLRHVHFVIYINLKLVDKCVNVLFQLSMLIITMVQFAFIKRSFKLFPLKRQEYEKCMRREIKKLRNFGLF